MSIYVVDLYCSGVSLLLAMILAEIHRKLDEELDEEFFVHSKFGV